MSRPSSAHLGPFPPLFVRLVRAAEADCPAGYAAALTAFGALALVTIPCRGVLPMPTSADDDTYQRVRDIAVQYLRLGPPEKKLHDALKIVEPADEWPVITSTINHLCSIRDTAHLLYGISLGVLLAELSKGGAR